MKFEELEINEKIKKAISDIGFTEMMPIQEKAIPVILDGKNIIGEAETGTGKTAAFLIPVLNNIDLKSKDVECLIVTPTRELAMQIIGEIEKIGTYLKPNYVTLVGGMSIRDQVYKLNTRPSIVVGTLGRINDHIRNNKLDLSHVKYFILDEADEMLKEGFKEDIDAINKEIPSTKQSLLFSATISKQILVLSKTIMDSYELVSVKDKDTVSTNIEQFYIVLKEKNKFAALTKLLDVHKPKSAIIFGRTKRRADELNEALNKCGYKSSCIHGDLSQQQRNAVMKKFRDNEISILVATDVAARGLDINDVSHIYNFDLPQEIEYYVHRIGRTGRAKKYGVTYSFIKDSEINHIRRIEKETNNVVKETTIPSYSEILSIRSKEIIETIENKLSSIDTTQTEEFANQLLEQFGASKLASVLVESLSRKTNINEISLTGEPGVITRRDNGGSYGRNRSRDSRYGSRDNNRSRDFRRSDSKPRENGSRDNRSFNRNRKNNFKTTK